MKKKLMKRLTALTLALAMALTLAACGDTGTGGSASSGGSTSGGDASTSQGGGTAAELLGMADRIGSLEKGKDADVVLFRGEPAIDTAARLACTIVNGEIAYQE